MVGKAEMLLRKYAQTGGDPANARDANGWTALHLVCHLPAFNGSEQCLDWLLRHNADVSMMSTDGFSPVHLAAADGNVAATKKLLRHGASTNCAGRDGSTPLHLAARAGHQAVVTLLLEKMADVSQACLLGNTALHDAAGRGHTSCVRLLLSFGADPAARNSRGETADTLATRGDHGQVLEVLGAWNLAKSTGPSQQSSRAPSFHPDEPPQHSQSSHAGPTRLPSAGHNATAAARAHASSHGPDHPSPAPREHGWDLRSPAQASSSSSRLDDMTGQLETLHFSPSGGIWGEEDRLDMGPQPSPQQAHPVFRPQPQPTRARAARGNYTPVQGDQGPGQVFVYAQAAGSSQQLPPHNAPQQEFGVQLETHGAQQREKSSNLDSPAAMPGHERPGTALPQPMPQHVRGGDHAARASHAGARGFGGTGQIGGPPQRGGGGEGGGIGGDEMDWEIDHGDLVFGKLLGSGTFGDVYKGKWLGSEVAIKVIRVTRALDDAQIKEFRAEVDIMATMRHVNIVQFVGACTKPPQLAIVTEYLPKMSLYDVMRTEPLLWPRMLQIGCQAAAGILYLHHRKPPIVHRDIKSDNFLIDTNYNVKVCDFGLARFKREVTHVQTSHNRAGTPGWMAPEVLRGEKFDETSDLYSFGVVLWEMLTLEQPWKEVDPIQLPGIVGFQGRRLRLPPEAPAGCPLDYISLIADCWHHHPQRRPKMREVVERLSRMAAAADRQESAQH